MIRKRLCIQCNQKQATYNTIGLKPKFCNECKTEEMINVYTNLLQIMLIAAN